MRRSTGIAAVAAALTLLFGSSFLFGVAMLPLALGVGMVAGQVVGEFVGTGDRASRPVSRDLEEVA